MEQSMQELYDILRSQKMTTKEEVCNRIKEDRQMIMANAQIDRLHSVVFYNALDALYEKLLKEIEETVFFQYLEDGWYYEYGIDYAGAKVILCHAQIYGKLEDGTVAEKSDQSFELIAVKTKLLSVDEYAKEHEVENVTVRQWIRRGKIRTAVKRGNEWKIPELTDPPVRGYSTAWYRWTEEIEELPKEYEYLNEYDTACFSQYEDDKTAFAACFYKNGLEAVKRVECNAKEREKLEVFMIAHPQIYYISNISEGILMDLFRGYEGGAS